MVLEWYVNFVCIGGTKPISGTEQPFGMRNWNFHGCPHLTSRSYIPNSYSGTGRDRVRGVLTGFRAELLGQYWILTDRENSEN